MQPLPTVIFRHKKENIKKCSLRGLENKGFLFHSYPSSSSAWPDLSKYLLLTLEAPPVEANDAPFGLVILDATWLYAAKMLASIDEMYPKIEKRSIPPHYRTAYPRYQNHCLDPERGLASIEAIYIAYQILGRDVSGLLDSYYWKESFLKKNNFMV